MNSSRPRSAPTVLCVLLFLFSSVVFLLCYGPCPGPDEFFLGDFFSNLGSKLYEGGFQPKPFLVFLYAVSPVDPHYWATLLGLAQYGLFLCLYARLVERLLGGATALCALLFICASPQAFVFVYTSSSAVWAACLTLSGTALLFRKEVSQLIGAAAGLLVALGVASRFEAVLLLPVPFFFFDELKKSSRRILIAAVLCGLAAWPVFGLVYYDDPLAFIKTVSRYVGRSGQPAVGLSGYPARLWRAFFMNYLGPLPLALGLAGLWAARSRRRALAFFLGTAVFFILFYWAAAGAGGRIFERFFFPTFILLAPFAAHGAVWLAGIVAGARGGTRGDARGNEEEGEERRPGARPLLLALFFIVLAYAEPWWGVVGSLAEKSRDARIIEVAAERIKDDVSGEKTPFWVLAFYHDKYRLAWLLRGTAAEGFPDYADLERSPSIWRSPRLRYLFYRSEEARQGYVYTVLADLVEIEDGRIGMAHRRPLRSWDLGGENYLVKLSPAWTTKQPSLKNLQHINIDSNVDRP